MIVDYEKYINRKNVNARFSKLSESSKVLCAVHTYSMMEVVNDMPTRQKFWEHFEKNVRQYEVLEACGQDVKNQQSTEDWQETVERIGKENEEGDLTSV